MSMRKLPLALAFTLAFGAATAGAQAPKLGQPITEADITAWNIEALPDGKGLPPGSGTAKQGAAIYSQKCALCHGENGVNPRPGYSPMVGPSKFDRIETMKTVPYYKYATTLYDVMRRSMPYPIPKTLTNDELYALSAYILFAQQDRRRGRGDGRQQLAAGEDAQPGQFRRLGSGQDRIRPDPHGRAALRPVRHLAGITRGLDPRVHLASHQARSRS